MSIIELRHELWQSLSTFGQWLDKQGYTGNIYEVYRPPETAELYAKQGKGISNSLHCEGLAADVLIYKRGVWLITVEDLLECGEFWESLSFPGAEHCWGGRFKRVDTDHFSIAYQGRK